MTEKVIPLGEIGKTGTVKVYTQAYVDKLEHQVEQAKVLIQYVMDEVGFPDEEIEKKADKFLCEVAK